MEVRISLRDSFPFYLWMILKQNSVQWFSEVSLSGKNAVAFCQALGCKIMWEHPPWPVSSRSLDASPVQALGVFWYKNPQSKSEIGRELWRAVDSQPYIRGGGGSSSSSTKLFKSWFCHFPAWWSLLMHLTFRIWFLAPQTWDNGLCSLPHEVVLNNKSRTRHEASHTFDTQSPPRRWV